MVRCLSTYIANSTKSDVLEVMGIERDLFGTFAQYERPYSPAVPAQVEELDLGLFIEAHGRRACEARVVCQGQPALAFDAGVPVRRLCGDARRIDRLVQTQLQWRAASRQGASMDKDTMRRWAAIGGFEAEVEKLFAQLAQRDETVAHQAEQIAILTNMVGASKRAIEAQDETIAILQKALGWTDLNDGATPGLATSTTQTSTLDTE